MNSKLYINLEPVILALKESFIALTPYFIISSIAILAVQGGKFIFPVQHLDHFEFIVSSLQGAYPIVLLVSISFHLGKKYDTDSLIAILLAFSILLTIVALTENNQGTFLRLNQKIASYALIIPIVSTILLGKLTNQQQTHFYTPGLPPTYLKKYFLGFLGSYVLSVAVLMNLDLLLNLLVWHLNLSTFENPFDASMFGLVIRLAFTETLFFLGLHGVNVFELFVDNKYMTEFMFNNLTARDFLDLFTVTTLPIAIVVLIQNKDRHAQMVAKLAMPFLCFNIGEILLYGLPIVFNRYLLIPYLFAPIVNVIIAYPLVAQGYITFVPHQIPWVTPPFINAYLATGGQFSAVFLQVFLLGLNIGLYTPFVRRYLQTQSTTGHLLKLQDILKLPQHIQVRESVQFQKAESVIVNSQSAINNIIEQLGRNELHVFYQPKVSVSGGYCFNFEAMLRLRTANGGIVNPWFLTTLKDAGLAPEIDIWVCQQAKNNLLEWQHAGFHPHLSIKLHSDTLADRKILNSIINTLQNFNVEFEISEKTFSENLDVMGSLNLLRQYGFGIAIDEFGSSYSNLNLMHQLQIETIKLDTGLLDIVDTERGRFLYLRAARICKELGYILVAKGVESKQQYQVALEGGIDIVQGNYFFRELPFDQVVPFTVSLNGSTRYFIRKTGKYSI